MSELFSLRGAGMRYNGAEVLRPATLDFSEPQMVAVVGPNGAGKSTLLGIMAGLRPDYWGAVPTAAGKSATGRAGRSRGRCPSFPRASASSSPSPPSRW